MLQLEQVVCPDWFCALPSGHSEQVIVVKDAVNRPEVQSGHVALPLVLYLPTGQSSHV